MRESRHSILVDLYPNMFFLLKICEEGEASYILTLLSFRSNNNGGGMTIITCSFSFLGLKSLLTVM
jgi:hypothetical protein